MATRYRILLAAVLALGVATPVVMAQGGVHDINQAVVENGIEPCDFSGGFPCVIDQPGSYRLTGDLESTDPDVHILQISADDVTIDLNGYALIGPATCTWTGSSVSCSDGGVGVAIDAAGDRLTVIDGTVRGAGRDGIVAQDGAVIGGVRITNCGGRAISAGAGLIVREVTVEVTQEGIVGLSGVQIRNSSVRRTSATGAWVGSGSSIAHSVFIENRDFGIHAGAAALVVANTVRANVQDGVVVGGGSLVLENTITVNNGTGLVLGAGVAGYGSNVLSGNGTGTVSGAALALGDNLCEGDTACP